ncbi:MotA/TolQ/ExbB proton channel family protein [uncultured Brevundimonas sp.]|jgi:biopolymer transport protein ExbB/TolQ|uniref:MotA/TolQ/ExbB proton channel family protein n=1 Tax=Brevundimonas sp. CEF1 TaxID=3442642 RepID=UPI000FBC618F|nr:MotA/TolQ/ExbB proton channel family protein [uncultured Brevundimonas sp.]
MSARSVSASLGFTLLAFPALAQAEPLTPGGIFADAAPSMKLIMILLLVAAVAAVAVTARKLMSGRHLSGGSAFLSALRLGGPLIGLLGGAFNGLMILIGLSQGPQPFHVVAPGLAEAAFLVFLGLFCGVVAVICHWAVEARIDRAVLQS